MQTIAQRVSLFHQERGHSITINDTNTLTFLYRLLKKYLESGKDSLILNSRQSWLELNDVKDLVPQMGLYIIP